MALQISNSPDITLLDFAILYDISGGIPSITLTNRSVGNPSGTTNLNNCTWWYVISTPSGVSIHSGSMTTPDVTNANWATLTIPEGSWPTPFGVPPYAQIEFSCASPYVTTLYVKDSVNNVYSITKQVTICRPNGNTDKTKGNFGVAMVIMKTQCAIAKIYASDTTNYTYQGILNFSDNSTWTMAYPLDADGAQPDPVIVNNKPTVIFPVGYSAEGYQLNLRTFSTYLISDYQSIKIQYKYLNTFPVYCNVDLCGVQCGIQKMYALLNPKCGTVEDPEIEGRLFRIQILMSRALAGIEQPGCGIDVPETIEQIKVLLGDFDCGCGIIGGINPVNNTTGSLTFDTAVTGDISAVFTNEGDNYLLTIALPSESGIPNLQQVTTKGNVTDKIIYSGDITALFGYLGANAIYLGNASVLRIGFQSVSGQNLLRMAGKTSGQIDISAADTGNSYQILLPAAQGSANTFLKNDGAGNLSWGAGTAQNLQQVTDGAGNNVTTNNIFSGVTAGNNGKLSDTIVGVYSGATLVASIENQSGAGRIRIKDFTSAFSAFLFVSSLSATRAIGLPSSRSGTLALTGVGTAITVVVGAAAGTGATASTYGNASDTGGGISVIAGTGTSGGTIAVINLSLPYTALGMLPHPVIAPHSATAGPIVALQNVLVGTGPGGVDQIIIVTSNTNLTAAQTYSWDYVITY